MATKNSFVFYTEWLEQFKLIASCGTSDDIASLCDGIKALVEDGKTIEMTALAKLAFLPMQHQIGRDREKWERTTAQRSESGKKGASARWQPIANDSKQWQPMANAINDMANDGKPMANDSKDMAKMAVDVDVYVDDYVDVDVYDDVSPNGDNNIHSSIDTALALPAPQFVAETDPKKMTDKTLEEEFDALWKLYPRKAGKADALRHYKAARKKGVTYDTVEDGIRRYAAYVEGQDPQFTAMGSTWFCGHRWEDQYVRKKSDLERLWDL